MDKRDVVVVGGGPAGYVAAIRAAQLGAKVTLVEEDKLGGTCLNRGCIPTKFLLRSVETYQSLKSAERYGISVSGASVDLPKMQAGKAKVVTGLTSGVGGLLAANKVEVKNGRAKLDSTKQIEIASGKGEKETVEADKIILATGARPIVLPIPGADSPDILGVEDLLELKELPKSLVIIGGGVVGVEMATVLAKLGVQVSLVEMMPHCLPAQDDEIAQVLEGVLTEDGIQVCCSAKVSKIEATAAGKAVVFSDGEAEQKIEAAAVAISVGYRPNTEGLGLEECGVAVEKGGIRVNEKMETSIPGIYAAGDVVGGMMLAYIAMAEGTVAAENALEQDATMDYGVVPQCIFTLPEVASVGITEQEAASQGLAVAIGRFPFAANGMAAIVGERRGLVKIISEPKYGQILGVHIIGPQATCLIAEAVMAMKLESTVDDILATIHAHPSLSEAIWEAAADVQGRAIHNLSRKRGG
ncbi:MAG: dihydrolipoyl dehydrogenase [Dehalococcoidales bacterium]|nr:dihydrolipoyl dehydrogenase [Dehalococcoidales bacterium]